MRKAVHQHLFRSYGHLPLLWIGMATEFLRTFAQRLIAVWFAMKAAFDVVGGNPGVASTDVLWFLAAYCLGSIIGSCGELLAIRTTDEQYRTLLIEYYKKLTGKDMAFYRRHQTGSLAAAFRNHLDGTMALVRLLRGDIIRIFGSITFALVMLFIVNWRLGTIVTISACFLCGYVLWASRLANRYRKPAQEIYRALTGEVVDEITNIAAFKSSGRQLEAQGNVVTLADREGGIFWARHKMTVLLDFPRAALTGLVVAITFYFALGNTSNPRALAWSMALTFIYSLQLMQSVGDLPDLVMRYDEQIARVYPTLEYITDKDEAITDPVDPAPLAVVGGAIAFKNVHFAYKTSEGIACHPVFSGLTLTIAAGEHVGIVGASGVGKSTLVNLLMRFDDLDAGSIEIDGRDIRTISQRELRAAIAYVPQEPLLFHRTVRDNIAYFKTGATDEEIVQAAKAAHAAEFLDRLEQGYYSIVGERGAQLSGGQRQRIVLARAILKNSPIIVFDEATSSLDIESERTIQDALPTVIGQHTAIVIAHRLSTVAPLDRIVVLQDGRIVEEGTHSQLLARRGQYYGLWRKQQVDDV